MQQQPSIRTTSHNYPAEEVTAMINFYGGKKCAVTRSQHLADWAHMLDAALEISNPRLEWMLNRKLRQDRHPSYAAEVRENIVPMCANQHIEIDAHPPSATLFLHEDILARTLVFEIELKRWRIAEIEAGRDDPGRPAYENVFTLNGTTQHRWHCAGNAPNTPRNDAVFYSPSDCPGVYPPSRNPFPVIPTLLSIPFSLLHTIPRLGSLVPLSDYQCDILAMGYNIIRLWSWDPPLTVVSLSTARNTRSAAQRTPPPRPIGDPSRVGSTFQSMRACVSYRDSCVPPAPSGSTYNFKLPSGNVFIGKFSVCWAGVGIHFSDEGGEQPAEMHDLEGHSSVISESTDESLDGQVVEDLPQFLSILKSFLG